MKKELIIITGASSGIGEATAIAFSKAGYPLLLIGRRLEKMQALNLPDALCMKVDVTDLDNFQTAVETAEREFGSAACIINNAGVLYLGSLHKQDPKEWQEMLNTNIMGVLNGTRTVINSMIERRHGTIINISSVAGTKSYAHHDVYCATKFGVHAITEGLRAELAEHNIRCILISPGIVETEVLNSTTDKKLYETYAANKKTIAKTISSSELAEIILHTYQLPQHICVRDLVVCPTGQRQ